MKYKVIKEFTDIMDDGYKYKVGDDYPRNGAKVSDGRIAKLLSNSNRQKTALIEEVKESKGLNVATPAQPEKVGQEAIPENKGEKPARSTKKK